MPTHQALTPIPRRLSRAARRTQLLTAAMPLAARQGLADMSLDDLAQRAGVTRNLLYHYFPRGRVDLMLAVVQEAERQLCESTANGAEAILDHALAPTHAWRIHRMAAGAAGPEIRATVAESNAILAHTLARARPKTPDTPPAADLAIHGHLGFAEALLERARITGAARAEVSRLLEANLAAALDAAGL